MNRINTAILIVIVLMCAPGTVQPADMRPELTRDYKFWRGPYEKTPGPFLCIKPDAVDVWVTCDRWPDTSDIRNFSQDAIRLSKAETDHDKALAVWQWMRRVKSQTNGQAPMDPFQRDRGSGQVNCPIKIFNVHGAHWCSGLGRVTALLWRALGRQGHCVHRASHGMAGLWYEDHDGVKRWHLFDCNFGGFTLDRSRKRVLGMNEFSTDLYQWMHIWYFGEPWPMPIHRMELKFRKGESLKRIWGNWGKPFHNNISAGKDRGTRKPFEKGPYPVEFGNGLWTYTPDLSSEDWTNGLTEPLKGMAAGKLQPAQAGAPGTAVWHFRTPYLAVESEIEMKTFRKGGDDAITLSLSVDNGKTWKKCWSAPADKTGEQTFTVKLDQKFKVGRRVKIPKDFNSPFGRYAFRLKLDLTAKNSPADCRVNNITFKTIVHQSIRALPQLWPGKNTITVRGSLEKGAAVRVTYVWDDPKGKGRKNVTVAEELPYTYEILAAGGKWEDVICKDLIVDTIRADGKGSCTEVKEEPSPVQELPPMPTPYKSRCRWGRPEKRKAYSIDKCIAIIEGKEKGSVSKALRWIAELGDPKGFDAAKKAAYDKELCKQKGVKLAAIFAMFNSDREKAREALKPIAMDVKNSPWRGGDDMKYAGGAWGAGAAHIALMAADAGWTDYGPVLAKALESTYMGGGNKRAIMRSFAHIGRPGDKAATEAVRKVLTSTDHAYTLAQAARAAGAVKDKEAVPRLRELLDHPFMAVRRTAAVALGRIGDTESAPKLRESLFRIRNWKVLDHHKYGTEIWEDEFMRGAAAEALGLMKDKGSLPDLKKALKNEPVEWVRKKIQEAIANIGS